MWGETENEIETIQGRENERGNEQRGQERGVKKERQMRKKLSPRNYLNIRDFFQRFISKVAIESSQNSL